MKFVLLLLVGLNLLTACDADRSPAAKHIPPSQPPSADNDTVSPPTSNLPITNNAGLAAYRVLFIGNSHVTGLTPYLSPMLAIGVPEKSVDGLVVSTGSFLADRWADGRTLDTLQATPWSHVVLQAQKYSQSGQVDYPTTAAQQWIAQVKAQQATPILFPEHPQRGNSTEGQRLHALHVSIAGQQPSCVAPVSLVWDRVLELRPALRLHHQDGNHAAALGRFLTALVFYEVITHSAADLLPFIESIDVDRATQDLFGQVVSQVIAENPPCEY